MMFRRGRRTSRSLLFATVPVCLSSRFASLLARDLAAPSISGKTDL
jgi:hypothetical protein